MSQIRVSEIFGPTIQGEGVLIGEPTVFVRTGGCDYRCSWCDSLHAVDSEYRDTWAKMTSKEVFSKVCDLSNNRPITVSLSGGNPAIQPFDELIELGHKKEYKFALETQASISQDWFAKLDVLVLSPKPPSSGHEVDWKKFDICVQKSNGVPKTVIKIVIFDDIDYDWARDVSRRYTDFPFYIQPGNHTPPLANEELNIDLDGIMNRTEWLIQKALGDNWFDVHILPQLHVLLWGNKRGV